MNWMAFSLVVHAVRYLSLSLAKYSLTNGVVLAVDEIGDGVDVGVEVDVDAYLGLKRALIVRIRKREQRERKDITEKREGGEEEREKERKREREKERKREERREKREERRGQC